MSRSCEATMEPLQLDVLYPLPSVHPYLNRIAVADILCEFNPLSHQSNADDGSAPEIEDPSSPEIDSDAGYVSPTDTLLAFQNMLMSNRIHYSSSWMSMMTLQQNMKSMSQNTIRMSDMSLPVIHSMPF